MTAFHFGFLKSAGEQKTFGSSNHITVQTPSAIPNSLPNMGTVRVSLRVFRGSGSAPRPPAPAPVPDERPWPDAATRARCRAYKSNEAACLRDKPCRWKRVRKVCAPRFPTN